MKIALFGNPNCGKTTLFNRLTGLTAQVGNYPGVTVESRKGVYRENGDKRSLGVEVIDLPGIYSLSPYSPEEVIARAEIVENRPDCVINIVDCTSIERSLYLTTQLLELGVPVVVAFNMIDEAEQHGISIDTTAFEKVFGVACVKISALKNKGVGALMQIAMSKATLLQSATMVALQSREQQAIGTAKPQIQVTTLWGELPEGVIDCEAHIADARYKYIESALPKFYTKREKGGELTKSDRIDKVLTHKIFGIPIFLGIMFLVFHLTFSENLFFIGSFIKEGSFDIPIIGTDSINSPGVMIFNALGLGTDSLLGLASNGLANAPLWLSGLITDGLLSGVFAVLSFIPQIIILFFFLSLLQNTGYMARVAFITDRLLRRFGLSGRAFLPLLSCFGCAVPGIMASRTLESESERKMTIYLSPFFSCGAKLPIWATFAAVMFGGAHGDLVVFAIYLLGIVVAVLGALVLKHTVIKGESAPFIMELPDYRRPQFRATMLELWDKLKHYLFRAATVIAGAVVIIWFLTNFSFTWQMVEPGESILGQISKMFSFLFVPLGFGAGADGWKFVLAVFTGLIAKEMVVATMGSLAGMGEVGEGSALLGTPIAVMISSISVPAAFAFMAFNLLCVPCMAAVSAARAELKGKKKIWGAVAFWMISAYVVAAAVFIVGTYWKISLIVLGALLVVALLFIGFKSKHAKSASCGGGCAGCSGNCSSCKSAGEKPDSTKEDGIK